MLELVPQQVCLKARLVLCTAKLLVQMARTMVVHQPLRLRAVVFLGGWNAVQKPELLCNESPHLQSHLRLRE